MRIRSIKPEFWRSEDITALDWETRLLFIGLWSYVDDNGVGRDNEKLILADLFALEDDPRETLATVSRGLQALFGRGLIARYEVGGTALLHITNWDKHQRIDKPNKARHEPPTCGNAVFRDTLATPSRHPRETPAPGAGEQGNRGTGEEPSLSDAADAPPTREDVERICNHLARRIEENGAKRPIVSRKWRDSARLLIDRDGHTEAQIVWLINWCQDDDFWRSNILSMPKFREKFDQLLLKARPNVHPIRLAADDPERPPDVPPDAIRLPPLPRSFFDQ